MVLQPVHAAGRAGGWILATPLKERPDVNRVAGITGALVLNAAAFLLLLVPMTTPPVAPLVEQTRPEVPDWIERKKPDPIPLPVEKVLPVVPPAERTPQVSRPIERPLPVDVPVLADEGIPVDPVDALPREVVAPPGDVVAASAGPRALLQYIDAPSPPYPRDALLGGHEGSVLLRVTVGIDGRPTAVEIERSSGRRDFDDAARRQVLRRWTFQPAILDGRPVEAIGLVPIDFKLG